MSMYIVNKIDNNCNNYKHLSGRLSSASVVVKNNKVEVAGHKVKSQVLEKDNTKSLSKFSRFI